MTKPIEQEIAEKSARLSDPMKVDRLRGIVQILADSDTLDHREFNKKYPHLSGNDWLELLTKDAIAALSDTKGE